MKSAVLFVLICFTGPAMAKHLTEHARRHRQHRGHRRVVGGQFGNPSRWPFLVYLNFHQPNADREVCGAALIRPLWILTAAQCVYQIVDRPDYLTIAVGRHERSSAFDKHNFTVEKIIPKAEYMYRMAALSKNRNLLHGGRVPSNLGEGLFDDDIALVKLAFPVNINMLGRRHLTLPEKDETFEATPPSVCRVAGWGRTLPSIQQQGLGPQDYVPPKKFHVITTPLVRNDVCKETISLVRPVDVTDSILCCGSQSIEQCNGTVSLGDAGSPVVCTESSGRTVLHGIVIYSDQECRPGKEYFLSTRVATFSQWILNMISEN